MSEHIPHLMPDPGSLSEEDQQYRMRQQAVAIAYNQDTSAPTVVAKGRGLLAEAILEKAKSHGIYVHHSTELVSLLMQVDLDKHIPVTLYRAVAELLAWLHYLDSGLIQSDTPPPSLTLPASESS